MKILTDNEKITVSSLLVESDDLVLDLTHLTDTNSSFEADVFWAEDEESCESFQNCIDNFEFDDSSHQTIHLVQNPPDYTSPV